MKILLLLLLASTARAASLVQSQDVGSGIQVFLSSQAFTAASAFSLGVVVPTSSTIECVVSYLQNNVEGSPVITFNGDTTAGHYRYSNYGFAPGGVADNASNSTTGSIPILNSNGPLSSHASFTITYSASMVDEIDYSGTFTSYAAQQFAGFWGGAWLGNAFPTKMTITEGAGTFTGYAKCTYVN